MPSAEPYQITTRRLLDQQKQTSPPGGQRLDQGDQRHDQRSTPPSQRCGIAANGRVADALDETEQP
jgi:hypothetical protein